MACWLLVKRILKGFPFLNPGIDLTFEDLYNQIEEVEVAFAAIEDADLKRDFLGEVQEFENWSAIFVRLFPYYMNKYIIDRLEESAEPEMLTNLVGTVLTNYREHRGPFVLP